ncbi:MAG: beta-mannosidase [Prevotellaceae bacterium]|nr:beta-mannosidase [Prevotellaceae bacterium]
MKRKTLLAIMMLCAVGSYAQRTEYSLGTGEGIAQWQLARQSEINADGATISTTGYRMPKQAVKGVVPGVVFTSYVEAGKEPCPEYADNIYKVDETKYNGPFWYRTEFTLPTQVQPGQRVWLCFDNTNRYADFWFNGHKVSGTSESTRDVKGHMMRSRFDVTEYYQQGKAQTVSVLIYDCDQKKTRKAPGPYGVACSPSYLSGAGWDWMPYVPGRLNGIPGRCYVAVTGEAVMIDPWVRSSLPTMDKGEIFVSSDIENCGSEKKSITLRGTITPGNIQFQKDVEVAANDTAHISLTPYEMKQLVIKNPKLWWPNGYGEPFMYNCKLETLVDGKVSDSRSIDFGIRKFEYRIEKNRVDMPVLQFVINGQRIFAKGGNWGMSEYLLRCHGKQYEQKIRLHKEMNYNMIRLWTGCVTDDEFYDYCDKYGILVWTDFWLYVAYNDVVEHDVFKANARDKVRRLRNHPSIALWCGANETRPVDDIDKALRLIVMEEDANDRLYTSCSNQEAKSGSGWWKDMTPKHHFEGSWSNLAFNKPSYPYGFDYGYGCRSEIGMATFPTYESTRLFIPADQQWPLPTDEALKDSDNTVYNKHFFGKEAWNGGPIDYVHSVNDRYGECSSLEEFCEKAQLINLEDMKGMYEAWNDKMWNDASTLLIWMSHPAYPSFVWQTYDYYYDPTGCYWGAKQACASQHVQWNCYNNSVKVINTTARTITNAIVKAEVFDIDGHLIATNSKSGINVEASNIAEAFTLNLPKQYEGDMLFLRLSLSIGGNTVDTNFYWTNQKREYDYKALNTMAEAPLDCKIGSVADGKFDIVLTNNTDKVSFANRLRLINTKTKARILPAIMSDGYVTLLPGETRIITCEVEPQLLPAHFAVLVKQYAKKERTAAKF